MGTFGSALTGTHAETKVEIVLDPPGAAYRALQQHEELEDHHRAQPTSVQAHDAYPRRRWLRDDPEIGWGATEGARPQQMAVFLLGLNLAEPPYARIADSMRADESALREIRQATQAGEIRSQLLPASVVVDVFQVS